METQKTVADLYVWLHLQLQFLDQRAHFTPESGSLTGVTDTLAVHVLEIDKAPSTCFLGRAAR